MISQQINFYKIYALQTNINNKSQFLLYLANIGEIGRAKIAILYRKGIIIRRMVQDLYPFPYRIHSRKRRRAYLRRLRDNTN